MENIHLSGKSLLGNQRGFALISVYLAAVVVLIVSGAASLAVVNETRHIEREVTKAKAFAAAEAGLQRALAQIANPATAFMGFIKTDDINESPVRSTTGEAVGNVSSFSVKFDYEGQNDWVVLKSKATVDDETRQLEGRVFLQSNLSKYLMYANTPTIGLGNNLVMGIDERSPGETEEERKKHPEGVPANPTDRAALYYTNNLDFSGSNIHIFGDTHAENFISGSSSNTVHGDTYVGGFTLDSQGQVTNDGITGSLLVRDGFDSDNIDRDKDGRITTSSYEDPGDYADRHDLLKMVDTRTGEEELMTAYNKDARREEVIDSVNLAFYQANNATVAKTRGYGTTTAERYFVFEPSADGTQTQVVVFDTQAKYNAYNPFINTPTNTTARAQKTDEFTLPSGLKLPDGTMDEKPILYNNGSAHVKGTIAGRVAVVASDDILFDGNVKYAGNSSYCSPQNSAAFMARDVVYFRPVSLEVSGIIYADKSSNSSVAIDSNYNELYSETVFKQDPDDPNRGYKPGDKEDGHFRHFGNLIVDGAGNTSNYTNDRAYVYDPNLKYYRPPGIPIKPELRLVRETPPSTT